MICADSKRAYTHCTIQFVDDGTTEDVTIADYDYDENDENQRIIDNKIFFYGLSPDRLQDAYANGEVLEGEWRVLSVDAVE